MSAFLDPAAWTGNANVPIQLPASVVNVMDAVRITDFSSKGSPGAYTELGLSWKGQIKLPIPLLGAGLYLGKPDLNGHALGTPAAESSGVDNGIRMRYEYEEKGEEADGPKVLKFSGTEVDGVVMTFELPGAGTGLLTREDNGLPAAIEVVATEDNPIQATTEGDFFVPNLTLPRTLVGNSGVVISATNVAIDMHTTISPDGVDNDGSWRGVFLGSVVIDLPDNLGGIDGIEAENFIIEDGGVTGTVDVNFDGGGMDVGGGMTASLNQVCVAFTIDPVTGEQKVDLCGVGGQMDLPSDYFSCMEDPDATLPVDLAYDQGVFTGMLDTENLPANCRELSFGSDAGGALVLGETETATVNCASYDITAEKTARFIRVDVVTSPEFEITLSGFDASTVPGEQNEPNLNSSAPIGVFKPSADKLKPILDDAQGKPVDGIVMPETVVIGAEGVCIGCGAGEGLSMPPMEVGSSGVEVCADQVGLDFHEGLNKAEDTVNAGDDEWMGLYAASLEVTVPFKKQDGSSLTFGATHMSIGSGGVSGNFVVNAGIDPVTFGGYDVSLSAIQMSFVHNTPTGFGVYGDLNVPFFDETLGISFVLDGQGGWLAQISASGNGVDLSKNLGPLELRLLVQRIAFGCEAGDCVIALDATTGIGSPVFDTGDINLQNLQITSDGEVKLDGGWMQFPDPRIIKIAGFEYELTKFGFGTRDGASPQEARRWVGLGGNFQLQDVLPVTIDVNEMSLSWEYQDASENPVAFANPKLEIADIKLGMEIPNVLSLDGTLRFCEAGKVGCGDGTTALGSKWFEAAVDVRLKQPAIELKGQLMVGKNPGGAGLDPFTFWYAQIDAQLPSGIPVPATGVSIYGFSGGFGKNVALNVTDAFPRQLDLANPVSPTSGTFVFMAGVTLGSGHDNGFVINTDVKLFVQIPGPVIVFNGQAWVATERNKRKLPPLLTVDIIFDGINKEFIFSLAARYQSGEGKDNVEENGKIVDASGNMEVFLSQTDWHVYLGTKAHPISAKIAKDLLAINAEAYVMFGTQVPFDAGIMPGFLVGAGIHMQNSGEALGGLVGYEFGLYAHGEMGLQMQPKHVFVVAGIGGNARVWVGPLSLGLAIDAMLRGETPTPMLLDANLAVAIELPWPFKDISFEVGLHWEKPSDPPEFPKPLKEIVFESEATGRTVRAFPEDGGTPDVCPTGTITDVPFDAITQLTFNRRMDCRDGSSVRPCPAGTESNSYFQDETAGHYIANQFTGWSVTQAGGAAADLTLVGGWGGALGAPESVGTTAQRRYETFSFRPTHFAFEECPGEWSNATDPDQCTTTTVPNGECRVLSKTAACVQGGAGCHGRLYGQTNLVGDKDQFKHSSSDAAQPGPGWVASPVTNRPADMDSLTPEAHRTWKHTVDLPPNACLAEAKLVLKWKRVGQQLQCAPCANLPGSPSRPTETLSFASASKGQRDFDFCTEAFTGAMFGDCTPSGDGYIGALEGQATLDLADFPEVLDMVEDGQLTVSIAGNTAIDFAELVVSYQMSSGGQAATFTGRYNSNHQSAIYYALGDQLVTLGQGQMLYNPPECLAAGAQEDVCCTAPLNPIACEGPNGDWLVTGYHVNAAGDLFQMGMGDPVPTNPVGSCATLDDAMIAPCPSNDQALCPSLGSGPKTFCTLYDGTAVAPSTVTTTPDCSNDDGTGPEYLPGAPFCPATTYELNLVMNQDTTPVDGGSTSSSGQTCTVTYQIEDPPEALSPYVAWTYPADAQRVVYTANDLMVQFNSGVICELYSCCSGAPLAIELRSADAVLPTDVTPGQLYSVGCNEVSDITALFDDPNDWEPVGQQDDFLIFTPGEMRDLGADSSHCVAGTCVCDPGYSPTVDGDCVDIDECATANGGCGDPALYSCTNTLGSFECADVDDCQQSSVCLDPADCVLSNGGCPKNTTCHNQVGAPRTCSCENGFELNPSGDCVPVTGCETTTCPTGSYCVTPAQPCTATDCSDPALGCVTINVPCEIGECVCAPGWATNSEGGCDDVDECATGNGGCGDPLYYSCTNTPGSVLCADIDECEVNHGGCDPAAWCTNVDGAAATCACKPGYDSDGLGGCVVNATCAGVVCGDTAPPNEHFTLAALAANTKYFMAMPNPLGTSSDAPLLETSFVTSQFETFTEALESALAVASSDSTHITLTTPEALDWLHTSAVLDPDGTENTGDEIDLDRLRLSEDTDSIHVFELASASAAAGGTLRLTYHSRPHGRCTCTDDVDCPGEGRCISGVCQAGHICDEDLECPASGTCDLSGPVVRRGGTVISEDVNLVLEDEL
ncbi:MAG: EGF domain-containing protein [Myxococcota bacterium]